MKIPQGYKRTEVGIIPEDWEVNSIGYVFSTYPTASYTRDQLGDNGDVKYIHYGDIHTKYHTHLNLSWASIPTITYKQALRYMHLRNGDLILADASEDYAGVGNCVEIKGQNNINAISGLHTVLLRDTKSVFADGFRGYITQMAAVKSQLEKQAVGTKVYAISYSTIKDCLLPIPPIEEQRRIAEVLSDVDGLITALDKKIAKKKLIKQAAMQQLLTGKKRLQGFSGEWETKKLGEISHIKTGKRNGDEQIENGKYPFFVRSNIVARIDSYSFDGEAILVPGEGGIGSIFHYVNGKFDYHQRVYKISNFIEGVYGKYIYYYMQRYFGEYAMSLTVKATVDSLRLPTFEEFKISIPTRIEEQQAIATILSDMDAEISDLERKRDKYKLLKNGMMQKLLTGQIRIK